MTSGRLGRSPPPQRIAAEHDCHPCAHQRQARRLTHLGQQRAEHRDTGSASDEDGTADEPVCLLKQFHNCNPFNSCKRSRQRSANDLAGRSQAPVTNLADCGPADRWTPCSPCRSCRWPISPRLQRTQLRRGPSRGRRPRQRQGP